MCRGFILILFKVEIKEKLVKAHEMRRGSHIAHASSVGKRSHDGSPSSGRGIALLPSSGIKSAFIIRHFTQF